MREDTGFTWVYYRPTALSVSASDECARNVKAGTAWQRHYNSRTGKQATTASYLIVPSDGNIVASQAWCVHHGLLSRIEVCMTATANVKFAQWQGTTKFEEGSIHRLL
jgi:hypothetical protein